MLRTSREEEDALVERIEADAADPDAWEDDPAPSRTGDRRTLGAQITVRLDPEIVDQLSALARARRVGHTQLARQLIEDGLRAHTAGVGLSGPEASFLIEVRIRSSGDVTAKIA
ncbi:MAG: ribbon-helix-helix protein, CopG family [Egibacteraceae bacterium]